MKKFFAILLVMMLVLSMSAVAMAAEGSTLSDEQTFTFTKSYKTTAGATPATFPEETLKFTVTKAAGNPDNTMIEISDHTVSTSSGNVTVKIPQYSTVGKWNYTVKEVAGNTQGVTYSATEFGVQVLVTYDENDSTKLEAQVVFTTKGTGEGKIDEIVNTYDLGTLTVDKNVTGNLASQTQQFDIDVVFTSTKPVRSDIEGVTGWTENNGVYTSNTVTFSLAHGDSVATIANIPAGVSYKVVEQAKHEAADANGSNPATGYTVSYTGAEGTIAAGVTSEAVVTNQKGTTVDTGITTDSLPYIMLIGLVVISGVIMLINRRKACND